MFAAGQRLLRSIGYDIHKIHRVPPMTPINVLPLVVQHWMKQKPRGKNGSAEFLFIEIGAHDGLHGDPIRPFVIQYHWKGILVEPQPKIFKRLVDNYRLETQLIFENAAIAGSDGWATLYAFSASAGLPDHASMLASFNREVVAHNAHGYRGDIEELKIPTITIDSLLSKYGVQFVDLLMIDTEGFDFEIIRMLGATNVRPAIIHFESAFMSRDQSFECHELLHSWGYRVLTIGIDTIAYMQVDDDDFLARQENKGYDE